MTAARWRKQPGSHAGVASEAHEHEKLEHLCRTITRAAVSTERLSLTAQGNIRYRLKTPYRDGTTDGVSEPLDKIAGSDFEQPQAGPQGEGQDAPGVLYRPTRRARVDATGQPDALSRGVCAESSAA